jgi:NSS family neurotransmitter:Na+ symporter
MGNQNRDSFTGKAGFVIAAAGSAVGLGNMWKFPYLTGMYGGALFLIFYIVFLVLLGIPIMMTETAIGRFGRTNAIDACKKIHPKWGFVGGVGVLGSAIILATYAVVGGWVLRYIVPTGTADTGYFERFSSGSLTPIIFTFLFIAVTAFIVMRGVSKGIEKVSKFMLPVLLLLLVIIMVYSLTLPGAKEGVKYLFVPDISDLTADRVLATALAAMGQVFFSLSLGMGIMITYGSYLPDDVPVEKNTILIVALDTIIAIIAGLAILPAVYSFGHEPAAGPGLLFITLPAVFSMLPLGGAISVLFFILVLFAALTSSISLLEVVVTFLSERSKMGRTRSTLLAAGVIFAVSILASLSLGAVDINILGQSFFDLLSNLNDKFLMPAGGFLMCIIAAYVWGIPGVTHELQKHGAPLRGKPLYIAAIKIISPVLIVAIFVSTIVQ